MKIGTLLTTVILSLSAVGGGLAVYVAATKHDTMNKISDAQKRLEIIRVVGEIPRYLNPERGFATNILFGPPVVQDKQRAELGNYRKQTDGAVEKMGQIRTTLADALDDGPAIVARMGDLKTQFDALRTAIDKAIDGPAEARRDAAKKIVSDNAVFNSAVTALLDEQVRRMAILNGDAYRQSSYANVAWTLRDIGGLNASLHKSLVGARRVATEAERMELSRSQGKTDQILTSLTELRGNPSTPKNVEAALGGMQEAYVDRFGQELKLAKAGAVSGQYDHDVDTYFVESQRGLPAWSVPTKAPSQAKCKHAAGHAFAISRPQVPESCQGSPSKPEGAVRPPGGTQGMPGCALHPRSRAPMCAEKMRTRAYRFSGGIRHSLRNGLTAYATLSSATNSSCHRRRRIEVACSTRSGRRSRVHRILFHVRDDARPPLLPEQDSRT